MAENDVNTAHVEVDNDDGTIHYEGVLGSFDYDPAQFELVTVKSKATQDLPASEYEVLKYIGNEPDGSKIQIPEGLRDGNMMFMGCKTLESMPKLPKSLENADSMFASCPRLRTASASLGDNLKEANFMFYGCANLERGPERMPKNLKDANFMFTNCGKLQNTPELSSNMRSAEYMFAYCRSLTKAPKIPQSMQEYSGLTFNCVKMDEASKKQNETKMMKERAKFEKQLNRKSFMQHVGSGVSAVMQCHAMRQAGYGFLMAPLMTHMMRKNGQFQKSLSGGLATMAMRRGGVSSVILYGLASHSEKKAKQREISNKAKLAAWDRVNSATGGNVSNKSMKYVTVAEKDAKRGFFTRFADMSYTERLPFMEIYGGQYSMREGLLQSAYQNGSELTPAQKHQLSEYYQEQVSACVAYYNEAKVAIAKQYPNKTHPDEYRKAMRGLEEVSIAQTIPLTNSMERLQKDFQIFNDGDVYNMSVMLKGMPAEKASVKPFADRMHEAVDVKSRINEQYVNMKKHHDLSDEAVQFRKQEAEANKQDSEKKTTSRFERMKAFGNDVVNNFMNNFGNKQDDGDQFGL